MNTLAIALSSVSSPLITSVITARNSERELARPSKPSMRLITEAPCSEESIYNTLIDTGYEFEGLVSSFTNSELYEQHLAEYKLSQSLWKAYNKALAKWESDYPEL